MPYVTDTHPLVWHFTHSKRLSRRATAILVAADRGQEIVYVPTIVLGELLYISESGQASIKFGDALNRIKRGDNYVVSPLDLAVIEAANAIGVRMEMNDRLIVATAQVLGVSVITVDQAIVAARVVNTIW